MSNKHIPFIPTTPPPLNDTVESVENEDFADFTGVLSPEEDVEVNLPKVVLSKTTTESLRTNVDDKKQTGDNIDNHVKPEIETEIVKEDEGESESSCAQLNSSEPSNCLNGDETKDSPEVQSDENKSKHENLENESSEDLFNKMQNGDTENCDSKGFAEFDKFDNQFGVESEKATEPTNDTWSSNQPVDGDQTQIDTTTIDNFADFSSFQFSNCQEVQSDNFTDNCEDTEKCDEAAANSINQNFADFSSAGLEQDVKCGLETDENESGFADFRFFDAQTVKQPENTSFVKDDKFNLLLKETFESKNMSVNNYDISKNLFEDSISQSLWKKLQDLEEAPSLKFRWPNSHTFKLLLESLKIDPRNILRNTSVPVFASGLGLLEPVKGSLANKENQPADPIESETVSNVSTIPPVQFDWTSSGLTNPLDASSLNLDYFATNEDAKVVSTQKNHSDLEEFLELNTQINATTQQLDESSNIFKLLSTINSSKCPQSGDEKNEVLQILDELPNLSFMRAKVLMFPIKNC